MRKLHKGGRPMGEDIVIGIGKKETKKKKKRIEEKKESKPDGGGGTPG